MSFAKKSLSVFGKLGVILVLLAAFVVGMGGVMLLALRSPEVKVPQVVGKDFLEGEKELAQFELKIRRRSDRFSQEKPNTILEQYPLPGDTLKAGQTVAVVVSRAEAIGDEKPAEVKKETVQDKPKGEEQSEVDKARQKRKAANKNVNANSKNINTDSSGNFNGNANKSSNDNNSGNSNSRNNNGGNANNRPSNSNSSNRATTPASNRSSNTATRPADNRRNNQ